MKGSFRNPLARFGPWLLVVAALAALVATAAAVLDPSIARPGTVSYAYSGVVMTLVDFLVMAGVVGLWFTRAAGGGPLKLAGFVLLVSGSAGIVVAEPLLRVSFALGNSVFGVVGPVQALGFILVGIAIIRGGLWRSWRRFAMLLLGLYVPFLMVPLLIASGGSNLGALAGYHIGVLLTGMAWLIESQGGALKPARRLGRTTAKREELV
ncbi:MAG: hypothetical protein M3072_07070 [Candidatus Dormibacteraeota bacterium]|nr:hypothetical protein [Candidatus Dormibacteraeota bacterium]